MVLEEAFIERRKELIRNIENTTGIYTLQGTLLNELLDISRMTARRELAAK